ncbi:MAG TPA: serine hydrolase domain-containing protein [Myxococcota bacterium]|nr:serine hydrolase domain-containing protein [Myxococcota bacterium]
MALQQEIHGDCAPRFARVRETFAELFATPSEVGGAVAIQQDGRFVVDLWAGHADAARSRPWERDTLVNVFSTTKGMTALCAHRLVDRGQLDVEAPAARYWPEFAQGGQSCAPRARALEPLRRIARHSPAASPERPVRMGHPDGGTGGSGALVGAGNAPWLSRAHLRLARGRARAACVMGQALCWVLQTSRFAPTLARSGIRVPADPSPSPIPLPNSASLTS